MQCNGNINQNFIIDGGSSGPSISACTSVFTNQINSCSGNTSIILGTDSVDFTGAVSATTYYGDGSNLSGISTQDTYVTGFTYLNNDLTIRQPLQPDLVVNIDVMTGLTVDGAVSATTYYGDGSNLSGISTQDIYITGSTYEDNILTLTNNTGGTINTHIDTFTALTITNIEVSTISATTYVNLPSDVAFSGTYVELKAMIDNNELLVGKKYVLTDYQTVYQINGSNSENNIQIHSVVGKTLDYTQFDNVPENIAHSGNVVTCVYAPPGSTIVTGQTFVITQYFSQEFIMFSPKIVNPLDFGVKLRFEAQRYLNITPNIVINDVNGKPVLKPGGVLNTEVHDDGPYMSMTGIENPSPKIEQLVLTAIDTNQFSIYSESLTYIGDTLTYDFNDTSIYDENGQLIGVRNGNILKRTNVNNTISINKDWRIIRYRRYGVDTYNMDGFLLRNNLNSLTSGTTIYKIGVDNYCTGRNSLSINHRYFLSEPYKPNAYINFAKTSPNIFLSGTTTIPRPNVRFERPYEFSVDISLPMSGLTGTTFAKDFNILPINNYYETNVTKCIIDDLNNVVFLPYDQKFGFTSPLKVDSGNGSITTSTFLSLPEITNSSDISDIVALDFFSLNNTSYFNTNNILTYGYINNYGFTVGTTFGGYEGDYFLESGYNYAPIIDYTIDNSSQIKFSIFGAGTVSYSLTNCQMVTSLIVNKLINYSNIKFNTYLTLYKNRVSTLSSEIKLISQDTQIPNKGYYGYIYDFSTNLTGVELDNINFKKNLITKTIDANNITSITTISTVQ